MLGPCFYFYIRATTGQSLKQRGKILLHFLPALLFGLLWIAGLFISKEVKIVNYLDLLANRDKFDPAQLVVLLIIDLHIFAYLIAGWRKLANCAKRTEPSVPNRVNKDRRWLRNLFIALFAVAVVSTILDMLSLDLANMRFTPFLLTIILCSLSYFGLRQSGLIPISDGEKAKKYAKSTLTPEASHEIFLKLQYLMQHEKIFADSALSLPKLAKRLAVSTHRLSQIINERFGQNFFNHLSSVRIEEAKKRLSASDSDKIALSEIAYAVGFNSLSAFSTIFKKQSGISPSQFQKQQLSHASA